MAKKTEEPMSQEKVAQDLINLAHDFIDKNKDKVIDQAKLENFLDDVISGLKKVQKQYRARDYYKSPSDFVMDMVANDSFIKGTRDFKSLSSFTMETNMLLKSNIDAKNTDKLLYQVAKVCEGMGWKWGADKIKDTIPKDSLGKIQEFDKALTESKKQMKESLKAENKSVSRTTIPKKIQQSGVSI